LLDMIDQHLAAGTKILMIAASRMEDVEKRQITDALRDNNEIRGEVKACREQLKRLPASARTASEQRPVPPSRPASGTGTSRADSRNKKASGKGKRR
ncbi:MAG: hypothetical protein ACTHJZ_24080, partial [Trinickia sp.]|uniref:hypothetical protein n=1 Tax=Trinickia sp. TaxID=2571163 RepID=UPI003F7ED93B